MLCQKCKHPFNHDMHAYMCKPEWKEEAPKPETLAEVTPYRITLPPEVFIDPAALTGVSFEDKDCTTIRRQDLIRLIKSMGWSPVLHPALRGMGEHTWQIIAGSICAELFK